MAAPLLAQGMLTALAAGQGIAPIAIDLNRTHATHPLWPGHARFHLVAQVMAGVVTSAVEIALLWWPGPWHVQRFLLAACLSAAPLVGYVIAMLARRMYGGTLSDPQGIPPARIQLRGRVIEFESNVVVIAVAVLWLWIAVLLY
jgi:hypothetical protein